jgi:hypothetical protein
MGKASGIMELAEVPGGQMTQRASYELCTTLSTIADMNDLFVFSLLCEQLGLVPEPRGCEIGAMGSGGRKEGRP